MVGPQNWVGEFMGVVCGEVSMGWEDFSKNCQFVVGLGNRVRFWQDGWCEDHLFRLAFQGCMVSPLIRRFLLKLLC